jgi:hypothetical protein
MSDKFSTEDRKLVVKELEKLQTAKLSQVASSRRIFKDEADRYYCIFGGKDTWHGISYKQMDEIERNHSQMLLVIAKKYSTRIDICVASVDMLVAGKGKLPTKDSGYYFHISLTEDGMFVQQLPELHLKKIAEVRLVVDLPVPYDLSAIKRIIDIETLPDKPFEAEEGELTHSDIEAKIILIGKLLGYRTFTPDQSKESRYGKLGDLCSEKKMPTEYVAERLIAKVQNIDVIWFDSEGFPVNCFEVEHTTDITKGLLRLYQIRKLRIKMFIVAPNSSRAKFDTEVNKDPFYHVKREYVFRTYSELSDFFEVVKKFALVKGTFLDEQ